MPPEPPRTRTIVAVDDAGEFLLLLADLLEGEGFQVITCDVAKQGYQCIRETVPDLLILDVQMPPSRDWLVLDLVKLDPRTASIPVIICSGATAEIEQRKARLRDQGCQIVFKPFELGQLLGAVERLIG
jgi:CheY-like chemotaxis protein